MPSKVLIVDDDRAIAQLSSMWVNAAGYETQIAHNGVSGLQAIEQFNPDVILLDVRMPDIDGFEVMRRLKTMPNHADIPVIFLTANVQEFARKQAMATGASSFLAKPFEPSQLIGAIETAIKNTMKASA